MTLARGERLRLEHELAEAEQALTALALAARRKSRWRVGVAEVERARLLVSLERYSEGVAACDEILGHFGASQEGPIQVLLVAALHYKRHALQALGDRAGARACCREVVDRFATRPEVILQEEVAAARAELAAPEA